MSQLRAMQTEAVDRGTLQINVTSSVNAFPVERAEISISYTGVPESTLEKIQTDSSGQTETIELAAPPEEWSLDIEEDRQPYSEYTLSIKAPGFEPVNIAGTEILANVKAIQNIQMKPADQSGEENQVFVIPAHTLYGDYPPKIAEAEIKPVMETGEIVLSRVVVPEYIVVHDGSPRDSTATNYYVKYKDYIKNVASSEIYATWPENTIRANVLAIMSFTLNRVYTEWYRNKGYDFTITSSTAFDHKWIPERNIFDSISVIVDELFAELMEYKKMVEPYVCDVSLYLWNALKEGKEVLLEGQLGSLKDPDHGIYPMVTSSSTLAGYGAVGAGLPPYEIKQIVTVCKAYSSAVGAGAFVSEIFGDEADELRRRGGDGGEFGATTGRPRRMGWFDCVASKYGCRMQGTTDVAFTVLDVLGYLDEIPVCVGYEINGEVTTEFPVTHLLKKAKPVLKTLPGWKCDIRGIKTYEELPENCRKYIEFIEEQIGYPITMVSNGPGRDDIIYRESSLNK